MATHTYFFHSCVRLFAALLFAGGIGLISAGSTTYAILKESGMLTEQTNSFALRPVAMTPEQLLAAQADMMQQFTLGILLVVVGLALIVLASVSLERTSLASLDGTSRENGFMARVRRFLHRA